MMKQPLLICHGNVPLGTTWEEFEDALLGCACAARRESEKLRRRKGKWKIRKGIDIEVCFVVLSAERKAAMPQRESRRVSGITVLVRCNAANIIPPDQQNYLLRQRLWSMLHSELFASDGMVLWSLDDSRPEI
jgi:hypothetical protein